jgi:hypothetical protein
MRMEMRCQSLAALHSGWLTAAPLVPSRLDAPRRDRNGTGHGDGKGEWDHETPVAPESACR